VLGAVVVVVVLGVFCLCRRGRIQFGGFCCQGVPSGAAFLGSGQVGTAAGREGCGEMSWIDASRRWIACTGRNR
jgi:hypothetical protein